MKLIQNYLINWNGKYSFELNDEGVISDWSSFRGSSHNQFLYKDISPIVSTVSGGNSGWMNVGWFFLFVAWMAFIINQFYPAGIVLAIGAIFFLIYFFKQDKVEVFKNNSNQSLFYIRLDSSKEAIEFLEEVKRRLNKAHNELR